MKIAVIGGTGLMGPYLTPKLLQEGHEVVCINRRGTSTNAAASAISCDRSDSAALTSVINKLNPEAIIDMVPYTKSDAESLCQAASKIKNLHVVAVSSIDVYQAYGRIHRTETGPYQKCPIKEEDALREHLSVRKEKYDKIGVERIYLSQFQNLSILRMPAIYGWPDQSRIKEYLDAVDKDDGAVRINPRFAEWGFTRASAQDCAQAIFLTLGRDGQHIYNVGERDLVNEGDWCQMVWAAANRKGELIYDENVPIPHDVDLNQGWHVDTSKIRSELMYSESSDRMNVLKQTIQKIRESERSA